ncbi:MAG: alpha-mannosidase, partial [Oligoflexales bacterium]|nr:alpha-mannosidase [Oligoflexales bacterium]
AGGRLLEFDTSIDWLSRDSSLKASFPLTVSNFRATYNQGLGTVERGNNDPKKYEVPSHQWIDLTDKSGNYGVSIIEDGKYGSDKPNDDTLRLTLLYTPNTDSGSWGNNATQDWGHHDFIYAVYGHFGDFRQGQSQWQALRLNQPLVAFESPRHEGIHGRSFSLVRTDSHQIAVTAIKKAEESDHIVFRFQELWGKGASQVKISLPSGIAQAFETDAQERKTGEVSFSGRDMYLDFTKYSPKTVAVRLARPDRNLSKPSSVPLHLEYDSSLVSSDSNRSAPGFESPGGGTLPAEKLPGEITSEGIRFHMGPREDWTPGAVSCKGQIVKIPDGGFTHVYILAAADEDTKGVFMVDRVPYELGVQKWYGSVGNWDRRIFTKKWAVGSLEPGFIKRDTIAWFSSHRHTGGRNDSYIFSYLFKYEIRIPEGARSLTLPQNSKIRIFAISAASDLNSLTKAASSLYDNFDGRKIVQPSG